MRLGSSTETPTPARASALKSASTTKPAGMIEACASAIEVVAIGEDSAVGNVAVVVVNDIAVVPVKSPVMPSPTKAAKQSRLEAKAKNHTWSRKVEPGVRIPARPGHERRSIHEPRIIFRHVNNLRVGWLDHNCLSLVGYFFQRRAL